MTIEYTLADPDGWGHMHDDGWGWMWVWGPLMMLFWIAVLAVAIWLIVRAVGGSGPGRNAPPERDGVERARDILAERYARGEISTQEYEERLAKLT